MISLSACTLTLFWGEPGACIMTYIMNPMKPLYISGIQPEPSKHAGSDSEHFGYSQL